MSTHEFPSPYNFVPLSPIVHFPAWDDLVSHDIPFRDGVCGTIEYTIEAKTPIFTRDDQHEKQFCNLHGHPFIKGSTIRGMLRNVLKIAAFGKFDQVDDRRFGIRDLSKSKITYQQEIQDAQPGILRIQQNEDGSVERVIHPCKVARIPAQVLDAFHRQQAGQPWPFDAEESHSGRNQSWRAQRIDVSAEFEPRTKRIGGKEQVIVSRLGSGSHAGRVVIFGFIPTGARRSKKHEFFFYEESNRGTTVDDDQWQGFLDAHSSSEQRQELGVDGVEAGDAWSYWRDHLSDGVPVFYIQRESTLESFGLAKAYRMRSRCSVRDAIDNVSALHHDSTRCDLVELIFGFAEPEYQPSKEVQPRVAPAVLKGRVCVESAFCTKPTLEHASAPVSMVLGSPKPSFNLAYLRQSGRDVPSWHIAQSQVRGWKRYPARGKVNLKPARSDKDKLNTTFRPLPEGTTFKGTIAVHNLRAVELGALLWAMDFGGRTQLVHRIGMAKPNGYGEVTLKISSMNLDCNDGRDPLDVDAYQRAFACYMSTFFDLDGKSWLAQEQLHALFAMADPTQPDADTLVYPKLNSGDKRVADFKHIKSPGKNLPPRLLAEPDGVDQWQERLQANQSEMRECIDQCRADFEAEQARRQSRQRAFEDERAQRLKEEGKRRRDAERAAQRERWKAMEPIDRVQMAIGKVTMSEAMALVRRYLRDASEELSTTVFPQLIDVEVETRRELLRQVLYSQFYAAWSAGEVGSSNISASKLQDEYAFWLISPDARALEDEVSEAESVELYLDLPEMERDVLQQWHRLDDEGAQKSVLRQVDLDVLKSWSLNGRKAFYELVQMSYPAKKLKRKVRDWLCDVQSICEQ